MLPEPGGRAGVGALRCSLVRQPESTAQPAGAEALDAPDAAGQAAGSRSVCAVEVSEQTFTGAPSCRRCTYACASAPDCARRSVLDASAASASPSASPSAPGKKTVQPEGRSARAASESGPAPAVPGRTVPARRRARPVRGGYQARTPRESRRRPRFAERAGEAPRRHRARPRRGAHLPLDRRVPRLAPGLDEMEARTGAEHVERVDEHAESGDSTGPTRRVGCATVPAAVEGGRRARPVGNHEHLATAATRRTSSARLWVVTSTTSARARHCRSRRRSACSSTAASRPRPRSSGSSEEGSRRAS